jgi:uncharacterized protein YdbL (DUF1318 family)
LCKLFAKEDEMLKQLAMIALLGVSLASAKSYTVTISQACQAGGAQLKPGQYTLKVDNQTVVLIDSKGNSIETAAKIETAERKFDQTAILISNAGGTARLQSITLAGSKSRVVFE